MPVTIPYPKWITTPEGKRLIVLDAEEEALRMTASVSADRQRLLSEADALGIKVDGRWSDGRLASEIKTAQDSRAPKAAPVAKPDAEVKADDDRT